MAGETWVGQRHGSGVRPRFLAIANPVACEIRERRAVFVFRWRSPRQYDAALPYRDDLDVERLECLGLISVRDGDRDTAVDTDVSSCGGPTEEARRDAEPEPRGAVRDAERKPLAIHTSRRCNRSLIDRDLRSRRTAHLRCRGS